MIKDSDEWETPQRLFDELNEEFHFDGDCCANDKNSKCYSYSNDFLSTENDIGDQTLFMNPPYSNPGPFIKKAWGCSKNGKIVCLIKCDTSTKTWGIFWNYELNKPKPGCEIRYLPKRLKFERNGIPSKNSANFPSVIVIMDRRNM